LTYPSASKGVSIMMPNGSAVTAKDHPKKRALTNNKTPARPQPVSCIDDDELWNAKADKALESGWASDEEMAAFMERHSDKG
jgi:hypothetical protein